MTIREAEQRTGLDRATIRFYEKEGLISPKRLDNGYRDYAEEEITALLRIKLLRELGVSLEEIRALQQGEQALPVTLEHRMAALEKEMADAGAARETCRAIREEGVGYESLDPEKYLNREVIPAPLFRDAPPPVLCPWRRLFARLFDLALYQLAWTALLALGLHINMAERNAALWWLDSAICLVIMIMVEPILLSCWGTTPGKAIFGLRVEKAEGGRLTYGEGNTRTMSIIWRGLGWNIPIYDLFRMIKCYDIYCKDKELPWDRAQDLVVEAKPKSGLRNVAFMGAAAAVLALSVVIALAGGFPPNRDGLTPAEFTENYNFLAEYYGKPTYILEEDGSWTAMETRNGAYIVHLPGLERQPLTWETDSAGNLTSVTVAWSWDGSGIVEWPGLDMQLLTLAFAAGEGGWLDYWSRMGLMDTVANTEAFSSLSRTDEGIRLDWDTRLEGDVIVADYFVLGEEDAVCSGRLALTIRRA
ncbi:Copper export regulator [uncultured Flavonifractor sp.]|nr:Copper export regulator [uncultured Flavonifractor sp.]